ncbi:MAG: FtsX-like permease family protein, partial [Muribaculaceae bacterium]|nr:FtsX-like permease family protein [Muribaculaceae bacterium]
ALILLAAIIGFLRIEIQLFHIRRRELALRIVNGANRLRLFGLMFTEIFVSIFLAVILAVILGILLQDFCDMKLNLIINNIGFNISDLWYYSLTIGGGLLGVCSLVGWIALSRTYRQGSKLASSMRRSRNHLFRNIMLGIQIVISIVFICGSFILINGGNKIIKDFNIPDNDNHFKEYIYFQPMYATEKGKLLDEIKRLLDLDKILLCGTSYTSINEIQENPEVVEKLKRHIYFNSYFTDDPTLITELGMNVEWINGKTDRDAYMLISDNLYRRFQELGILSNNALTIEELRDTDITFPIEGIIKSISYDAVNESLVFIMPNWEEAQFMEYLLIPHPGKGASLAKSVDETVRLLEPELINKVVSNYRERICPLMGFIEAVKGGGLILGCVSLLICAMSIFSTVALDTRARKKEVAIRKVNGARSGNIYRMFGRVYIMLITISLIIAVPVCVLFNRIVETMAKDMSSEICLSPIGPVMLGCAIVIVLILMIVGWQIHSMMKTDPSKIIAKE